MSAIFRTEFRDLQDEQGNNTKASTAKFVCIALADHANDEGEGAYPSIGKLSLKTSLSRTAVINALDALKFNGVLIANGTSKYDTINYTVNPDCFSKDSQPGVLVLSLDSPSQPGVLPPVNPVDPNHPLTIPEPSMPKGDLVDAVLQYEQKPTSIRTAIKEYFRLNVNWETKTARQWMEWAVSENITPDQIARAADLWRTDKQFNWSVPTLKGIFEKWPMLNSVGITQKTDVTYDKDGAPESW